MVTSKPLLYSFRRCPYAMRARMALLISGIEYDLCEVELGAKPEALRLASPKATVPVLCLPDGSVLEESLDIMRWALKQNDAEGWLAPFSDDPSRSIWLTTNDGSFKADLDRSKYPERYDEATGEARARGAHFLKVLNEQIGASGGPYMFSARRSLADIAIFPFVRQFANIDKAWFDELPYPHLKTWLTLLVGSDLFTRVMDKGAK